MPRSLCLAGPAAGAVLFALSFPLAAQPPASEDVWQRALARYTECIQRIPFRFQTEGRERIAGTRDPRALAILAKGYVKPADYEEYARYTIATLLGRHFSDDPAALDTFAKLRRRCAKPVDAWLWQKTVSAEIRAHGVEAGLAVLDKLPKHSVALKCAVLGAFADSRNLDALNLVPRFCAELPKRQGDRRMMVSALSGLILAHRYRLDEDRYKQALRAYIGLLGDDVGLVHSTEMVIARHLSAVFKQPVLFIDPEPWLRMLEAGARGRPSNASGTVSTSSFFGVQAEGDRICYVVDMSDSMCKPIDPGLIKKKRVPITGPRKAKRRKRGELPDESDIPWNDIKSRFDLAREHLKISIQRLTPDKRFCVVTFGTEAETLESCKGMVKATRGNVLRVVAELDSIQPGPPKPPDAPDGTLRGSTNMHAGLKLAFSLRPRGQADRYAYVDEKAAELGCDTIFLLSDGAPSMDEFYCKDKDYGEGNVVHDAEYGVKAPRTPYLYYWGPYDQVNWLVEDVKRLNAYRKAQIHCIGIGEANIGLLDSIASSAMGEVFLVGAKAKQSGGH